jgi:hypothetical protein
LETAKVLFKSMAEPMPLDKGVKVIVQRSDSTWAHATVRAIGLHAFDTVATYWQRTFI